MAAAVVVGGKVEDWDEVGDPEILELDGLVLEAVDVSGAEPGGVGRGVE